MARKRRPARAVGELQERLNDLWPAEVQQALARERKGQAIPPAEQDKLLELIMRLLLQDLLKILDDLRTEGGELKEEFWVKLKPIGGRLRAFQCRKVDGEDVCRYIGDVRGG